MFKLRFSLFVALLAFFNMALALDMRAQPFYPRSNGTTTAVGPTGSSSTKTTTGTSSTKTATSSGSTPASVTSNPAALFGVDAGLAMGAAGALLYLL